MPNSPTTGESSGALRLWRLAMGVVVLAVFARAAAGEFVTWDDNFNLYENPHLNPPTLKGIAHYWFNFAYGLYIPLTYTVWGALALVGGHDQQAGGLNPWVFHGANVLLHAAAALAAFEVLRRLVSREGAGIGAMLFALHPLQVESVAWAAGMKDVLAGLLGLVAIWQYLDYARAAKGEAAAPAPEAADTAAPGRRDAHAHYALATIAFIAAMLAKPSAMVIPAIAFAIDYWLLKRPARRIFLAVGPWLVLSAACAAVARIAQDTTGVEPVPLWARPFVAGDALAFYLYKLLWPLNLSFDYGRLPHVVMENWWFYLTWLAPAVIGVVLWLNRRRRQELFIGGVIFVVALSPVLGLATFQFQYVSTVADHYVYLAMLGVGLAAGAGFELASKRLGRSVVMIVFSAVLAGLAARSAMQIGVWKDNVSLFSHAIEVNPASSVAHAGLGVAYNEQGKTVEAERRLRRAIELNPDGWMARANLASILEGRGETAEAIEQFEAALAIMRRMETGAEGAIPEVAYNLARQHAIAGSYDEALACLELALTYLPNEPSILAAIEQVKDLKATTSPAPAPVE